MENEIKVEAEEKAPKENNTDKENFSGNKSDDSSSQHGSENSTKVGGIRLVSLSTLIDKPKAWVKEALMEPEVIELNSDDDSDDVVITECASIKDKNSKIKSDNCLKTSDQKTKRTDQISNNFKLKSSDSLQKSKDIKNVQITDENVDYDNFTSCRVVLEKVPKLEEKLKSKLSSKNNSSSSEDEEMPLSKLKSSKRPRKPGKRSKTSKTTIPVKQSSSENELSSTESKKSDKESVSMARKTRNARSINSIEKPESEKKKLKSNAKQSSSENELSSSESKKSDKESASMTRKTGNARSNNSIEKPEPEKKKLKSNAKQSSSDNELSSSESKKSDKEIVSKARKTRNTRSMNSIEKFESEKNDSESEFQVKKTIKKSKKMVGFNLDNEIDIKNKKPLDSSESKNLRNKKSTNLENENPDTKSIKSKIQENKTSKDRNLRFKTAALDSDQEISNSSDSEDTEKIKTISKSENGKIQNKKNKKIQNQKLIDSESENSKQSLESENKEVNENDKKSNAITNKSKENEEKNEITAEETNENVDEDKSKMKNSRKKKTVESKESDEETSEVEKKLNDTEEIIENSNSKNDGNDLKITVKKTKTVLTRKRVISSESDSEKINDKKNVSENEEIDQDEKSDKPASTALNKKKRTRVVTSEESDQDFYPTKSKLPEKGYTSESSDESEQEQKKSSGDDDKEKKKIRRRIKTADDSNDSTSENELNDSKGQRRKKIRKVLGKDELSSKTKSATKEEMERRKRIADRQKMYNEICKNHLLEKSSLDKVVLDFDPDEKKDLISVHPKLVSTLKPHQANGIKFMWDCCFESLEHAKESKGSGCILAHCMGLGKTLQVVTLIHTLMTHEETGIKTVMVVCPLSTVLNWVNEFNIWLSKINGGNDVDVYEITKYKKMIDRSYKIKEWHDNGGVLVIGYEMFRNLSCTTNKRIRKPVLNRLQAGLVNPGPDLVVCDEGHLLKNEKARISVAMNKIATLRRIVLTGTPLQNNLKEYYCMIQFVKPNLLGTYKEYTNRFVNPIVNGQYIDSTPHDIEIMKRRSHVLHKLLDGVVQRRDYSVLAPFLPPKQEYVLYLTLHPLQEKLYEIYIQNYSKRSQSLTGGKAVALFSDFQELSRIWTHPRSLRFYSDKCERDRQKQMTDSDEMNSFICDDESDASTTPDSSSDDSDFNPKKKKPKKRRITRAKAKQLGSDVESSPEEVEEKNNDSDSDCKIVEEKKEEFNSDWWVKHVDDAVLEDITYSSKLLLFFKILKKCEEIGDKVLVFSQSLFSLNLIEYFLDKLDYASHNKSEEPQTGWLSDFSSSWDLGLDYFRLDGSSSVDNRAAWCKSFNDITNIRARLFLISTKAGGLGINLVAANRVIIFDVSWNPSHDIQSIFRVYRFGQTKPCYIYRFIAMGTMEEKVYERQVTKLAISKRVIDEHQIDRHYNQNDLNEIYKFTPMSEVEKPIPMVPKDRLLAETLQELSKQIFKYHEHDSLLEHKEDEELDEEERKAAWDEFENEKQHKPPPMMNYYPQYNFPNNFNNQFQIEIQNTSRALEAMLRERNPTWTDLQIQQSIPILLQQVYQFAPGFGHHPAFPQPQFGMAQPQPTFPQPNTSMMQQ